MYGPLSTISRAQMEQQFLARSFGAHQLTMRLLPATLPHGEGRIVMTSSVMGLISTPVVALTRPVNMRWRRGQTRCAWSYATAELKSA